MSGGQNETASLPEVGSGEPVLSIQQVCDYAKAMLISRGATDAAEGLSVRTVRYYREKGIVSAPLAGTVNAHYGTRHVLEAAYARLAGHLKQMSLAQAAAEVPGMSEADLRKRIESATIPRQGSGVSSLCQNVTLSAAMASASHQEEPNTVLRGFHARMAPACSPPSFPAGSEGRHDAPFDTMLLAGGAILLLPVGHALAGEKPQITTAFSRLHAAACSARDEVKPDPAGEQ